jgi:hypothetical protein|tara:strand:+ start:91 stop:516 length:426 start_codon:yes stop_codon:yes gene_type:complete
MVNKFLKFNIVNTGAPLTQGVQLVNADHIQSVAYNAGALTIVLDGAVSIQAAAGGAATDPNQLAVTYGARVITLNVLVTKDGTGAAPTITNGAKSPAKAIYAAMTANPGGVQSTVQLGLDEAVVPVQMYFSSFAIATASIV